MMVIRAKKNCLTYMIRERVIAMSRRNMIHKENPMVVILNEGKLTQKRNMNQSNWCGQMQKLQ
jgi:hypothetical protein